LAVTLPFLSTYKLVGDALFTKEKDHENCTFVDHITFRRLIEFFFENQKLFQALRKFEVFENSF